MNTRNNSGVAAMGLFIAIPVLILAIGVIWKIVAKDNRAVNSENASATSTETAVSNTETSKESETVTPSAKNPSTNLACGGRSQVERLNCIFETAVQQKNSGLCMELQNPSRDICLQQVGMNAVSEAVCARVSKIDLRDVCYRYVGIQKVSTQTCDKIVTREETDECYLRIAQITRNVTLCKNVQTMERHNECLKVDPANKSVLEPN